MARGRYHSGSAEQIFESSVNGNRQNEGERRIRSEVSGYGTRSITVPNRVHIHLINFGKLRTTTAFHSLVSPKGSILRRIRGEDPRTRDSNGHIQQLLTGNFESSAGSQSGTVIWSRNRYDEKFNPIIRLEESDKDGAVPQISAESGLNEPS